MDKKQLDVRTNKEKAKEFVRNILAEDFKQKADENLIDNVADRVLKAIHARDKE